MGPGWFPSNVHRNHPNTAANASALSTTSGTRRQYAIMTPPFEFVASTTHIFVIDLLTAENAPIPRYDWSRDNKEPTIIFDHASFRTFVASNSSFNLERLVSLKVSKNDAWPPVRLFRGSDRQSEGKKCSFLFFLRKRSCML